MGNQGKNFASNYHYYGNISSIKQVLAKVLWWYGPSQTDIKLLSTNYSTGVFVLE